MGAGAARGLSGGHRFRERARRGIGRARGAKAAAVPSAVQGGSARAPEPVNASQGDGEREGKGSVHGAKQSKGSRIVVVLLGGSVRNLILTAFNDHDDDDVSSRL